MSRTREDLGRPRSAGRSTFAKLALLVLAGVLLWRHGARRRGAPGRDVRSCGDLAQEAKNRLGAIQGYCELAKMKGENGRALESRMDAAIEAVGEVSALIHRLTACRRDAP